jgi:hypothetical protein
VPVAALISVRDFDTEGLALGTDPDFMALIERARSQHKAGMGLSSDEVRRELGIF